MNQSAALHKLGALILLMGLLSFVSADSVHAQDTADSSVTAASDLSVPIKYSIDFFTGIVTSVRETGTIESPDQPLFSQEVAIKLRNGKTITVENDYAKDTTKLHEKDQVVVSSTTTPNGTRYAVTDRYRIPQVGLLAVVFLLLVLILSRSKGLGAILGLLVSVLAIIKLEIPAVIAGHNPFWVSLGVTSLIAFVSLYLAHGVSKRTTIAVVSTFITLVIAIGLALGFVHYSHLSGQGSEEAFYLQTSSQQAIDLTGLLLGGILIGALGVLDDITTAQVAVIDELKQANPELTRQDLYRHGISVGREHIASLVNTLVLAYIGVALPLVLLVTINHNQPLWVSLNSEYIMEEVVRALVGSCTLVLAVPIATFLAAYWFDKKTLTEKNN